MPSFSHAVEVSDPPEVVFPWLLEQDRVPRWTGDLSAYEVLDAPLARGSRIREDLTLAGRRFPLEMQVIRYEPPRAAETRFSSNGIDVVSTYALEPVNGGGTRLTQSIEAKAGSLGARLLIPMIQPRLEQKLTEDLERLRGLLAAS